MAYRYRSNYDYNAPYRRLSYGVDPVRSLFRSVVTNRVDTVRRIASLRTDALRSYVKSLEDRRLYYPDAYRPAAATSRAARRIVVPDDRSFRLPNTVSFADPSRVAICVRRKQRREVLMAKGKGGGAHKRPRFTAFSDVKC